MNIQLHKSQLFTENKLQITGSKSETNRLLLLQALFPLEIENQSNSDDAQMMRNGLKVSTGEINISHAGTAMRFLTAYFSVTEGKNVVLTGSERMKERPIGILVEALQSLGADIQYVEKQGFPPLKIVGKTLYKNEVSLQADVSSQYISALLLVGAKLCNGLKINLLGECTSLPYLKMTLSLLEQIGVKTSFLGNVIQIFPLKNVENQKIVVESDWSSASYFYSFVALSRVGVKVELSTYKKNSLQGDSVLAKIYQNFGVKTTFYENKILIEKEKKTEIKHFVYDFTSCPDIAQTLAVTCFGLKISCDLQGLHTLKIKETDRLKALKTELTKLGAEIEISGSKLQMKPQKMIENVAIDTYNDHRMALAFAPLCTRISLIINDSEVVSKSYPDFWTDCEKIGIQFTEL